MASTWSDVTDQLHTTISSKWSELGYASSGDANIHKYLPEHQHSAKLDSYYLANVGATKPEVRAWYIWTRQALDFETFNTTAVEVEIEVGCFYKKGVDGAGARLIQSHMSIVQQAIRGLDISLNGTVRTIRDWGSLDIDSREVTISDSEGEILQGRFIISAAKRGGTI